MKRVAESQLTKDSVEDEDESQVRRSISACHTPYCSLIIVFVQEPKTGFQKADPISLSDRR